MKKSNDITGYIPAVRAEAKKVVWPTLNEVKKDTLIVLSVCVFFAAMYWAIDSGVLFLVKSVLGKMM